jgi:hypothetical protein
MSGRSLPGHLRPNPLYVCIGHSIYTAPFNCQSHLFFLGEFEWQFCTEMAADLSDEIPTSENNLAMSGKSLGGNLRPNPLHVCIGLTIYRAPLNCQDHVLFLGEFVWPFSTEMGADLTYDFPTLYNHPAISGTSLPCNLRPTPLYLCIGLTIH